MADVVEHFRASSLEFVDPHATTRDDYGPAPMSATSGTRFLIPSLCDDCGGRLYTFAAQEDLTLMSDHYNEMARGSAWLYSHLYTKDNILLQINGDLPEDQAAEYNRVLQTLP